MLAIRTVSSSSLRCRAGAIVSHYADCYGPSAGESSKTHVTRRQLSSSSQRQITDQPATPRKGSKGKKSLSRRDQNAMRKAQMFAQGLKEAQFAGTAQNPLEPLAPPPTANVDRVERTVEGQIEEILRYPPFEEDIEEPDVVPLEEPGWRSSGSTSKSISYRARYKAAFERINGAFVVSQLRRIYQGQSRRTLTKAILIQKLMAASGWPTPRNKARLPEKAPTVTKVLEMPDNALFLFLRDTRLVHDLMMNKGITFSVVPAMDANGKELERTVLQAEGEVEQLSKLEYTLASRAEHMTQVDISKEDLHGFIPPRGLLQFISSVTGVHIEPLSNDMLRISSMNPKRADHVTRLLQTASLRASSLPSSRSQSVLAPQRSQLEEGTQMAESDLYSVLPFFSSPSMLIPWENLSTSYGEMLYRLRKVHDWHMKPQQETIHRDELLEEGRVYASEVEKPFSDIQEYIRSLASIVPGESKVYTLTFGHLLFRHDAHQAQSALLSSPIPGQWPLIETRIKLQGSSSPIFSSSLTPAMAHHLLSKRPTRQRRLQYRSLDGKTQLTFTHTFAEEQPEPVELAPRRRKEETENWLAKLDAMVAEMEAEDRKREKEALGLADDDPIEESEDSEEPAEMDRVQVDALQEDSKQAEAVKVSKEGSEATSEPSSTGPSEGLFSIEQSSVSEADIMMPDRPVDARLKITAPTADKSATPVTIVSFFEELQVWTAKQKSEKEASKAGPSAPSRILDNTFQLERDDEISFVESQAPDESIFLRSVRVKDMILGAERTHGYNELVYHGVDLPPRFWRELAKVTRDVTPTSKSLSNDKSYRL